MPNNKVEKIINLSNVFSNLEDKDYVIVKLPDIFPDYRIGSDIDIFCYNIKDVSQTILSNVRHLVSKDITIDIEDKATQIYIDIMINNKIHFRFDIYNALPIYKNISVKESFFTSILEGSESITIKGVNIKVPSEVDEGILRYIEYHEWYALRPDKIKHIEYIKDKLKIDIDKVLDKLHFYTSIPVNYPANSSQEKNSKHFLKDTKFYFNIRRFVKKIKTKQRS